VAASCERYCCCEERQPQETIQWLIETVFDDNDNDNDNDVSGFDDSWIRDISAAA
jgi:hypothetical protein